MKPFRFILFFACLAGSASAQYLRNAIIQETLTVTGKISPAQITSDQNNYAPTSFSTSSVLRLSTDASRTITGLAGGADGRYIVISNVGSFDLVLADDSSSSTAANRFALATDVTLAANGGTVALIYDGTSSRWRPLIAKGGSSENPLTFSSPLSRSTNTISIPAASGSVNGYLSSADWTTFNGKFGSTTKAETLDAAFFAADAGSNDTYVATLSPAITAYTTGVHYRFKAATANTGAATINFNSVGAKTIKKAAGGVTTDLADNDIRAGQWVDLVYDGTNMQMQSTLGNAASGGTGTVTHTAGALTSNAVVLGAGTDDTKVVAGITSDGTSALNLGVAGTSVGKVVYSNATSGTITVQPPTGALGTVTVTMPAATDTLVGRATTDTLTGKKLVLSAALGTDDTYEGTAITGLNAGATIAQWEAVYLGSSSTWLLADANGSSTYPARGLAVAAYSSTNAAIVLVSGTVRNDAWSWTPGGTIYLSTTAGALTQTAPSTSGDKVQQVGFALTADIAWFNFASGEYLTVE